ncbi:MAG: hypothetical protein ACKVZJ_14205 [Phycisphaerales bacterium]
MPNPLRFGSTVALLTAATLFASTTASAAEVGSALISRQAVDTFNGLVAIYVGARIPAGDTVPTFSWFRDNAGPTHKVTPLLFEETAPGVFRVRAIGTTRDTNPSSSTQSAPFEAVAGTNIANGPNFTFGYISAAVSPSGAVSSKTGGAAEYSAAVSPGQGLTGEGSTNRWHFSFVVINSVAIDTTTFGRGTGVTYKINNPEINPGEPDRTYSASVSTLLPPPPCGGADFNNDGVVNTPDLTFFLGRFGQPATPGSPAERADFNASGTVDTPDLVFFLGRFGSVCAS